MTDFMSGPTRPIEPDNAARLDELRSRMKGQTREQKLETLRQVAQEFEAILLQMLLKQMRNTVDEAGLIHGGRGEEIFRDFLDEEYAKLAARHPQGLGLAAQIYEQYSRFVK